MNIRQQKYKKNRIAGMNMYNAARAAGYSHSTATHAGIKLEPSITGLDNYLEQAGLTNKRLAIFLSEVLEANKVVGYLHQYKRNEKGRIEELGHDEAISNEFLEVPDMHIRLKAVELILKAKGLLQSGNHVTVNTNVQTIVPQHAIIFTAIKEEADDINGQQEDLHAEEGADSNRLKGQI